MFGYFGKHQQLLHEATQISHDFAHKWSSHLTHMAQIMGDTVNPCQIFKKMSGSLFAKNGFGLYACVVSPAQ